MQGFFKTTFILLSLLGLSHRPAQAQWIARLAYGGNYLQAPFYSQDSHYKSRYGQGDGIFAELSTGRLFFRFSYREYYQQKDYEIGEATWERINDRVEYFESDEGFSSQPLNGESMGNRFMIKTTAMGVGYHFPIIQTDVFDRKFSLLLSVSGGYLMAVEKYAIEVMLNGQTFYVNSGISINYNFFSAMGFFSEVNFGYAPIGTSQRNADGPHVYAGVLIGRGMW